jgi:hypothetical protein
VQVAGFGGCLGSIVKIEVVSFGDVWVGVVSGGELFDYVCVVFEYLEKKLGDVRDHRVLDEPDRRLVCREVTAVEPVGGMLFVVPDEIFLTLEDYLFVDWGVDHDLL